MARNVVVGGAVGGCAHVFSVDACLCLRVEAIALESVVGIHSESHDLPRIGSDGNGRVAGLVVDGELNAVQEELVNKGAIQCGFCTPGMAMTGTACVRENPDADEAFVRDYMRGNYCRCTGYQAIVEAILAACEDAKNGKRV